MFMYMGGLAAAIRNIDGKNPELVVTNTRDPGKPEMTSIDKFIGTEFRSRYINPTWIEGMKKEGYAGAGEMRSFVEYLWGWDATVSEVVDDAMWKETFDVYVQDKHNLGMKDFFESKSPFAYQDMTGRMVETIRKGYWKADSATQTKLLTEFVESVNKHGSSGAEFTSGNPRLLKYVMEAGKAAGIPVPALEGFQRVMEKAIGGKISNAARAAENFVTRNEARIAERQTPQQAGVPQPSPSTSRLQGFLMEAKDQVQSPASKQIPTLANNSDLAALWIALPVLGLLFAWRWRRHRA
jgi:cobaltochelatase CobN